MASLSGLLACVCVVVATGAAAAEPPADAAALFGAREQAWGVAMSPDGGKISYLGATPHAGIAVVVVDIASAKASVLMNATDELKPRSCAWKTDNRLICELTGVSRATGSLLGFSRIIAMNADGSKPVELGDRHNDRALGLKQDSGRIINWLPDDPNNVLMSIWVREQNQMGTLMKPPSPGLSAQKVNVMTGTPVGTVEPGNINVSEMDADASGKVRLRATTGVIGHVYARDHVNYFMRAKNADAWQPIGGGSISGTDSPDVDGFDESGDNLFLLKPLDGRRALYRLATDGSNRAELVFAHPIVDVDGVLRIGKYRRPVAARYTVDSTEYKFFDPALVKLSASLAKALPGNVGVDILDESWDGNRKLVFAGSDADPGRYYLYDKTTHELAPLVAQRPGLADLKLASVAAIKYPARDGTPIPAYLTLPPAGVTPNGAGIVMPHGGPSSRDELGFDWLAQFFAAQGYAVLQPNFRGSTGYGEAWYAKNGFQSWPIAIGDINDGARWLAAQGKADAKKLVIFGWSYGGYVALQGAETEPALYKAVVAVAPVTDLTAMRQRARNFTDANIVANFIGEGPHVLAGSPTHNAAKMAAPVLLFHGDHDINVDIEQSQLMQSALKSANKSVQLVTYPGLDHQLADAEARTDMLRKSATFVAAALAAK